MVQPDLGVFGRGKSKIDYDRAAEEFAMRKRAAQMNEALVQRKLDAPAGGGADAPSSIREWNTFQQMQPDQQKQYLQMKRASQIMNLGGSQVVRDPMGGAPTESYQVTPKPEQMPEFKGKQQQAIEGAKTEAIPDRLKAESVNEAQLGMPQLEEDASYMNKLLEDIKTHKGLKAGTGMSSILPAIPGTKRKAFDVLLDQVKGKQFMTAYQTLKGGGQITEVEGQKATEALARMNAAQSEDDFIAAVNDFQNIVNSGLARARQKTQLQPQDLYQQGEQQFNQNKDPLGIR